MAKTPTHIKSLARSHTEMALNALVGVMRTKKASRASRVAAVKAVLDRGWGRPTQTMTGNEEGGPLAVKIIRFGGVDEPAQVRSRWCCHDIKKGPKSAPVVAGWLRWLFFQYRRSAQHIDLEL